MSQSAGKHVAVIGGGLGGLSAAVVTAARGYRVTLFEKNDWLGGKAAVLREDGYRFDMGPTILTMPSVLRRVWDEAGAPLEEDLDLVRLDPQWRCFFEDGTILDLKEDVEAMAASLDRLSPRTPSGEGFRRFQALARRLHDISGRYFFYRPIGSIRDMFRARDALRVEALKDVLALRSWSTYAATVRKHIPDSRAAQMIDHYTQYVGSNPYEAPAVLAGIASMQAGEGVWYPIGGTGAVPRALVSLGERLGVEYRTGVGVGKITTDGGRVAGVETDHGETLTFDAVVSNMDSVRTHRELLSGEPASKFLGARPYEPACSGVVLYLGLRERYEHLLHHNFVFSRDPEEEFDAIYRKGEPAPDPTCYVAAPSCTEPEVAPENGEALYILVHAPYLRSRHDWSAMLPSYRRIILDKMKRTAGCEDIESRISVERVLTPSDIHQRYSVLEGAIYGLASHGRMFGAFKPINRSAELPGLYLAGGAAHPGPGMPMVIMSGWIAADAVAADLGR
jgi:phytoene desaturase